MPDPAARCRGPPVLERHLKCYRPSTVSGLPLWPSMMVRCPRSRVRETVVPSEQNASEPPVVLAYSRTREGCSLTSTALRAAPHAARFTTKVRGPSPNRTPTISTAHIPVVVEAPGGAAPPGVTVGMTSCGDGRVSATTPQSALASLEIRP